MRESDKKTLAELRRRDLPVRAGRGAGFHKDKSKYDRKTKHNKSAWRLALAHEV